MRANVTEYWDSQVKIMRQNLLDLIRKLRADEVCGMSRSNARAIVSTKGITVAPAAFDRLFEEAIQGNRFFYE